jgi:hypothetical protein
MYLIQEYKLTSKDEVLYFLKKTLLSEYYLLTLNIPRYAFHTDFSMEVYKKNLEYDIEDSLKKIFETS